MSCHVSIRGGLTKDLVPEFLLKYLNDTDQVIDTNPKMERKDPQS